MMGMQRDRNSISAKYPIMLISISILSALWISLKWNVELRSQDEMQTQNIELVVHTSMPELTGVETNAMLDRTIADVDHIKILDGWATWKQNQIKTLHIYAPIKPEKMSAYAYERSDLNGRIGAQGFFLMIEDPKISAVQICVMNSIETKFYSLAGSAC